MEDSRRLSNTEKFDMMGRQPFIPLTKSEKTVSLPTNMHHHSASLDDLRIEEQPAWLDDLLSEPASPKMNKGHRRSASDTSAYLSATLMPFKEDDLIRNHVPNSSWRLQDSNHYHNLWQPNSYENHNNLGISTINGTNLHTNMPWRTMNRVGTSANRSFEKQVTKMKEGTATKQDCPGSKMDSKRIKQ